MTLRSALVSTSCALLFSGREFVSESTIKPSWYARRLDADGIHVSVIYAKRGIGYSGQVARNGSSDLSVRGSGIPATRAYIPPSTPLLRCALLHNPSFEAFAEGVLCLGMLSDLTFKSFASLG